MSDYSFFDRLRTFRAFIITKLFYRKARLIRRPFYLRGKKGLRYGKGLTTGCGCRFDASNKCVTLTIGKGARIGDYVHINANDSVSIGDNVLIASKVFISDTSHGAYSGDNQSLPSTNPSCRTLIVKPVQIGTNVWIGENVVILPGTIVGNGCIVGANTVLTGGCFPDNSIIVGAPARVIKQYNKKTKQWERVDQ